MKRTRDNNGKPPSGENRAIDPVLKELRARREDQAFQKRLAAAIERSRGILERLASLGVHAITYRSCKSM